MKVFACTCGGRLYFHNSGCVLCGSIVARCWSCRNVAAMKGADDRLTCGVCEAENVFCRNRTAHDVCSAGADPESDSKLCSFCQLNRTIPDLTIEGNQAKWRRIERAKHRVLYNCQWLGLPVADSDSPTGEPLRFDIKSKGHEPVSTGHANGVITIDLDEADSVHREKIRVAFDEPQRTLVGHFRHELGHYYWQRVVEKHVIEECRAVFGDERNNDYAEAMDRYYAEGPPANWREQYISRYATMHPWEDFAETFNACLDMIAVIDTASQFELTRQDVDVRNFEQLLSCYAETGIVVNELNRDMGLLDLVPELLTPAVTEKLRFIHRFVMSRLATDQPDST